MPMLTNTSFVSVYRDHPPVVQHDDSREEISSAHPIMASTLRKSLLSCGSHKADICGECPQGHGRLWCNGDCEWDDSSNICVSGPTFVPLAYHELLDLDLYPFQPVRDEKGRLVNVMLVKSSFGRPEEKAAYEKYKNEILFLGIMSYETFPFPSPNPYTTNQFGREEYIDKFPGWLNMYRNPDEIFPDHVKVVQMSQSDFGLPAVDYQNEVDEGKHIKRFDFAYVMSSGGAKLNAECTGWGPQAKNFTFAKEALEVMCGELDMTGVLLATRDSWDAKACNIPASCKGKILQTPYVSFNETLDYFRQSSFLFIPQVYDASPRVVTQAMTLNLPVLMNRNIVGGWKYINDKTGEFFHDMSDLRESLDGIKENLDSYEPRNYITENYGNERYGKKFRAFVEEHFSERVKFPQDSTQLIPS
jgi:hypothetical protein